MSRSLMTIAVVAAFLAAVAFAATQGSMHDCTVEAACQPWGVPHKTCKRKSRMDLRFTMDQAYSRWTKEYNGASGELTTKQPGVPYFFCPVVDELQAFSFNHSAPFALLTANGDWDISDMKEGSDFQVMDPERKYLNVSVFGMGSLPYLEQPGVDDDSSAMIVEQNSSLCPMLTVLSPGLDLNNTRQSAMVQMLVLNFTMTEGDYKYETGFNQPIQSGFASTCDETDRCKLFDDGVCIGLKRGKKNCAKCISTPEQVTDGSTNIDLKIWASYYGTDNTGRKFMSGSENPLSFTEFSAEPVFNKVGGELGGIERKF